MRISIKKFGDILISRPAGKEAALVMRSAYFPENPEAVIELDFADVFAVAPSWLDEVLMLLRSEYGDRVICITQNNQSVIESLRVITPPCKQREN